MAEIFKREPGQWSARGYLLYLLALPLIPALAVSVFKGDLARLLIELAGLVLLNGGAWLTRHGLRQEAQFRARNVARAPTVPLKTLGGLCVSAGVMLCSYLAVGQPLAFAAGVGLLAFAGFWLAYGLDPRADKGVAGSAHGYTTDEVVRLLESARERIAAIESAAAQLRSTELAERLLRIVAAARRVVSTVEQDPRDLRRARKFLNVYLDGARRVSEGYARAHPDTQGGQLEDNFRKVLITMESVFDEQHARLLENDTTDLDVQIEVLSTQLEREGAA